MKKKIILLVVIVLFAGLVIFRIGSSARRRKSAEVTAAETKPVYTQMAAQGSIQAKIKISGSILAIQQADVFSRVPGKLIRFLVEEGDAIRENQEIAQIDRDEIGGSFTAAPVKSPISGLLLKRYDIDPGAKVSPMVPLATVGNINRVKAVINLPEKDFMKVSPKMKAQVEVDAYPGEKFEGVVATVAPQLDMLSRTGKAEIVMDNAGRKLRPGMFGSIEIITASHSGVIVVPRDAVLDDGNVLKVFTVKNGKAEEKTVKMSLSDDYNAEITEGLSVGEEFITTGQKGLKNGDPVKVIKE